MGQWLCVPMVVAGLALWRGMGRAGIIGDGTGIAGR
jgi:hypothetical protein